MVKLVTSVQQANKMKLTVSFLMCFVHTERQCLKPLVVSFTFAPVRRCFNLSQKKRITSGSKKRELVALRRHQIREQALTFIEMRDCESYRLFRTTITVKQQAQEHLHYRGSLAAEQLIGEIKKKFHFVPFIGTLLNLMF